jgi:hypothetical protein
MATHLFSQTIRNHSGSFNPSNLTFGARKISFEDSHIDRCPLVRDVGTGVAAFFDRVVEGFRVCDGNARDLTDSRLPIF